MYLLASDSLQRRNSKAIVAYIVGYHSNGVIHAVSDRLIANIGSLQRRTMRPVRSKLIHGGIILYTDMNQIKLKSDEVIVECTIPECSLYYKGRYNNLDAIITTDVILNKILK